MGLDKEMDLSQVLADEASRENSEQEQDTVTIPHGMGFSIEDVQNLIKKYNNIHVPVDDPNLITVTILNAFLHENKKLQDTYMVALRQLFGDLTQSLVDELQQNMEEAKSSVKAVSLEGLIKLHTEQTKQVTKLRTHLRYACLVLGASTFFNIIAVLAK